MFRENGKRMGLAGMLMISIVTSLAVSMLVLFAAPRYISFNDRPAGDGTENSTAQIDVKPGQDGIDGELLRSAGQLSADDLAPNNRDTGTQQDAASSGGPAAGTLLSGTDTGSIPVTQAVAKKATAGVVGITVERAVRDNLFDSSRETEVGFGSGVVVSSDGYIDKLPCCGRKKQQDSSFVFRRKKCGWSSGVVRPRTGSGGSEG